MERKWTAFLGGYDESVRSSPSPCQPVRTMERLPCVHSRAQLDSAETKQFRKKVYFTSAEHQLRVNFARFFSLGEIVTTTAFRENRRLFQKQKIPRDLSDLQNPSDSQISHFPPALHQRQDVGGRFGPQSPSTKSATRESERMAIEERCGIRQHPVGQKCKASHPPRGATT